MKNKQYASIWKNLIIILQLALSVVFMMSAFLLTTLSRKSLVDMNKLTYQSFVESEYYGSVFEDKVEALSKFLINRKKFETNGVYDSEKEVNIVKYARSGSINNRSREYVSINVVSDEEMLVDGELLIDEEAIAMFETYRLGDLVAWSKEGYVQYSDRIEEPYLPLSGMSIADGVKDGWITQEQAQALYDALAQTLDRIGEEETQYKRALNEFEDGDTNLSYIFMENGTVAYTNMADYSDGMDLLSYAKEQGSYIYCNDQDLKFQTNIKGMEDYFYNEIDGQISGLGRNAVFMVAIDTQFPYDDDFTKANQEFVKLHPWGMVSVVAIVVSLFCWIVSLVYLTLAAGRTAVDDEIHLNWLDRIKTEIFFVVFVAVTVFVIVLGFAATSYEWDIAGMLIMVGVISFIYDAVFLLFYMSMIRRMKANVLWEYSLTRWIIVSTKRVIGTWKASVRIILQVVLLVLVFLFLSYQMFANNSVWAAVLLSALVLLLGILYLREAVQKQEIMKGIKRITEGDLAYKIPLGSLHNDNRNLAEAINNIGDGLHLAVEENTKNERMKADLITNVSHDIKTPLTSIINYVNLMKMEQTDSERMKNYIAVLEEKSQRLRQLTEDLVEASRISSGNIVLQMTPINLVELIYQTSGEFNEKFEAKDLTTITKLPKESVRIMADGRRIWRVLENLYNNVAKYALAHTRVYVTMEKRERDVEFSIKNISEQPLSGDGTDLTERFTRGDESRSTEGSGLGLSIARNLTTIMGGTFKVDLDGDLFLVTIIFPLA